MSNIVSIDDLIVATNSNEYIKKFDVAEFMRLINLDGRVVVHYTEGSVLCTVASVHLSYAENDIPTLEGIVDFKPFRVATTHPSVNLTHYTVGTEDNDPYNRKCFAHIRVPYVGANWFFALMD